MLERSFMPICLRCCLLICFILIYILPTQAGSFHAGFDHTGSVRNGEGHFSRTSDGIIVYPDAFLSGNAQSVRLQVITSNIIRVICTPTRETLPCKSLITVYSGIPDAQLVWEVKNNDSVVILSTHSLIAAVTIASGAVRFTDSAGREILAEKKKGGRSFEPAVFDGASSFHIRQTFETVPGEAIYGLGQHQDGQFNYQGRQVDLFQNNTEVAIPFFISSRNYGVLWDNYSHTLAGDIRPYKPLSAIKLFSKQGEAGWLTASYYNDKNNLSQAAFEKAESSINYAYLNDSKQRLPSAFKPASGLISWEGSLASEFTGAHTFRCTYGGYVKIWVDGKLLIDRWRQAWNPGSAVVDIHMEKGKRYPVKIQWTPDGNESYLTLNWKAPSAPSDKHDFNFSSESGRELDYYFIYGGNMDEVIAGYRMLTGKAPMVPKWALGFWQSRERYKTQKEILSTVKEFRRRSIPLDNIVLDWNYWKQEAWGSQEFDASRFPDPDAMIRALHDTCHTHFMISVWPKFYEGIPAYRAFDEKGWLYKRNIADSQRDWIADGYVSTFYDAFNPDARKAFWELLDRKLYRKGIDAWWMDASEPDILSNVSPEKRKELMTPTALGPAATYLNAYPLENARGIYEGQRASDSGKRVFILTRSAFAGSQHYAAAVWSGDIAARWSDMKAQVAAGLNFSLSGIPYWTTDIGGFAVERRFEHPQGKDLDEWREQMTRWYQFGAFCPLFRVHGQYPYREIFNTAPENHPAYQSMLYYDKLRYRLMPYLYSLAGMTWRNDYTIMRGLVMDFPRDTTVKNIGDQYMFGPSLLVNPVCTYQARSREVWLPLGQGWYDLYSGQHLGGGQMIHAEAPYERIPVYVKEGSIIPCGPALQYTDEKPADTITLYIYTGKNAAFNLYEDEGTNYHYEHDAWSVIPFSYNESDGILTIGKREGAFPGMLETRIFRIMRIARDKPVAFQPDSTADETVSYNGEARSIQLGVNRH